MDLQLLLTLACLAAAGAWLVRRVVQSLRGGSAGCGACASCPASETPVRQNFVPMDRLVHAGRSAPIAPHPATTDHDG